MGSFFSNMKVTKDHLTEFKFIIVVQLKFKYWTFPQLIVSKYFVLGCVFVSFGTWSQAQVTCSEKMLRDNHSSLWYRISNF